MKGSDYQQILRIAIEGVENPVTFRCHEHLFLEVSGLHDSSCFKSKDNMITLCPEEKIPHIKAKTIKLFVHWLYYNRFTNIGERECDSRQLLELYYFGEAYAMTVLKNVVIDHLLAKSAKHKIPLGCTKKLYKYTTSDDQLRRLWVDFYVWEVPEYQFLAEMKRGQLDHVFVQDLALAQMDNIRAMQVELTQEKPLPMTAPYLKASSAYHIRDAISDACCRRDLYEGEGYFHRTDERSKRVRYERENASLRATVEKFRMRFERIDIENLDLKSQLRKVQEKIELLICNVGSKVRDHDFIDHCKLLWSYNFDHPDGLGDSIDCVSGKTSKRGKLVDRLRI